MKYLALLLIVLLTVIQLPGMVKKGDKTAAVIYVALMLIGMVYIYGLASYWQIKTPDVYIVKLFDPLAHKIFIIED